MIRRRTCFAGREIAKRRERIAVLMIRFGWQISDMQPLQRSTHERMPPKLAKQKFRGFAGACGNAQLNAQLVFR
jgi:hypothetical protein